MQNQTTRKRRRGTIFTDGLKALPSLPHQEKVLRLKQELHDEFVMNMHSQDRVTRSASRGLGSSQPQRRKRVSGIEIPESPSPSRLLSTRASRFHLSATKSTSPLARKSRFLDQSSHTPSNRTLSPKHEEGDRETSIPPHPTIRVMISGNSDMSMDDDIHSPISHNEGVSLNRTKTPTVEAGLYKRATNSLSNSFSEVQIKRLEEEVKDLKDTLSHLRKDREQFDSQMHTMNSSLETALRECQRRCAEYADDVKCLKYTLSEKNPADRKLLYQQERQIEALRHSLSERQQNAEFTKLSADEHHVPKQDDIENAIYSIHHETKKILLSYDDNFTAGTPDLANEDDLRSLFMRTLGITLSSPVNSESLEAILGKNGLQAIICALFASALCDWVFAKDFESTIAKSSMLLNMYREHISSLGGETSANESDEDSSAGDSDSTTSRLDNDLTGNSIGLGSAGHFITNEGENIMTLADSDPSSEGASTPSTTPDAGIGFFDTLAVSDVDMVDSGHEDVRETASTEAETQHAVIRHANDVIFLFQTLTLPEAQNDLMRLLTSPSTTSDIAQAAGKLVMLFCGRNQTLTRRSTIRYLESWWTGAKHARELYNSDVDDDIVIAHFSFESYFRQHDWELVFSGQGKVVPAVWTSRGTIGEAVGCLTDAGLWTTDSANCGTFTGVATTESGTVVSTILSTSAGYCNIIFGGDIHDHLSYACGNPDANTATATEVLSFASEPFLGFGEYWDLGVTGSNPPTRDDTSSFHIAGDEETGDLWVLTWQAL
ncbi:hypothetical protein TCE0_013r00931 [Talaromyces pinophilus]|uniref:Uncharacterized protein n=1 Tax=Talaromyces pinophilus TaxID=128442 RepID=A0A698XKT2_TALPI|nr:hypothetical protein TCE0_013r00931 [Talaromyces pinophilus]